MKKRIALTLIIILLPIMIASCSSASEEGQQVSENNSSGVPSLTVTEDFSIEVEENESVGGF